jgi:hypothetical protein
MISLTEKQLAQIMESDLLEVNISIVPAGELTPVVIKTENIVDPTCVLDRNLISTQEFGVGNVEAAELSFTLINEDGLYDDVIFEGGRVTFEVILDGDPVQLGIFTVDQRPTRDRLMTVRALDLMARFNRKFKLNSYSFPITLKNLVSEMCNEVNVVDDTGNFTNYHIEIPKAAEVFDDCTLREVLSWIAGLAGANALIAPNGKLVFRTNEVVDFEIEYGDVGELVTAESPIEITGVEYVIPEHTIFDDGETVEVPETRYLEGVDGYVIDLSNNPLMSIISNKENCLEAIGETLIDFSYLPVSNLTAIGLPHIVAGDIIRVNEYLYEYPELPEDDEEEENGNGEEEEPEITKTLITEHLVYVTNHKWVVNGQSVIRSVGETETERGYATGIKLTDIQKAQIARMVARRSAVDKGEMTTTFEDAQLNLHEEIANALGFYMTKDEDEFGRQVIYIHDQPTLEGSDYIEYKPGAGDFAWTTTGWNDGNPDWQYGVTKNGSMVMQIIDAVKIRAELVVLEDNTDAETVLTQLRAGEIRIEEHLSIGGHNILKNPRFGATELPDAGHWYSGGTVAGYIDWYGYLTVNEFLDLYGSMTVDGFLTTSEMGALG